MTAGPLALVGGGELLPGNEQQDGVLVRAAGAGPAFVLATAAARERPDLAVENARRWFAGMGLAVEELPVLERAHASSAEIAERAATGRFFYLVGGDPGLVVDGLAGSAVWRAILAAWRSGAALGGSSAGAMAMCRWSLIRGGRGGGAGSRFEHGLGPVRGAAVVPHFESFERGWLGRAPPSDPNVVLIGLDERTAALWQDGAWSAAGPGAVTVIAGSDRRVYVAGERIEGLPDPG